MTVYRPARFISATLLRVGDLRLNNPPADIPYRYSDSGLVQIVPVTPPEGPIVPFIHPEAIGTALSTYDDVVIDTQPRITNLNKVQTNWTTEPYRLMQLYERPYWVLIRCDGYNTPARFASARLAIDTALEVASSIWADALNYQLTKNIAGFAFLQPNLNMAFTDDSVITRQMQSELVQKAHELRRPCMFITTRPFDVTTTIGPEMTDNANSKQPLAYPILGANPVFRDRLMAIYPEVMGETANASILLAHFNAFRTTFGRDRVTPLNLDCGMIIRPDQTQFTSDGVLGATTTDLTAVPRISDVLNFLAALGVTNVGIQVGDASSLAPLPPQWLPETGNLSGQWSQVWSNDDTITVEYIGADAAGVTGVQRRTFRKDLTEFASE